MLRPIPALAAVLVAAGLGATPVRAAAPPDRQALVMLTGDHLARAAGATGAAPVALVQDRRPLTGVRTTLPVLGRTTDADGRAWLRVALPGRPNGRIGWISTTHTLPGSTPWRLHVDLSARRITISRLGQVVRGFRLVVGTRSTPTPRGRFFVEEAVALTRADAGGPFALATSARSEVLQEFEGGPGQIALHGTWNLPGALGTAASHGCLRLGTGAIRWLARRIGAGVPLTIVR